MSVLQHCVGSCRIGDNTWSNGALSGEEQGRSKSGGVLKGLEFVSECSWELGCFLSATLVVLLWWFIDPWGSLQRQLGGKL